MYQFNFQICFAVILFYLYWYMPSEQLSSQQLSKMLQEININFAYKMLHLQICLSREDKNIRDRSTQIADLTALYMKAVESLQGRYELGFSFFNNKIQNLMKQRSVVQELFKSVNDKKQKALMLVSKTEVEKRREQYDIRMTLQNQKFDHKKVKQMIKTAQMKINIIQSHIKTGIFTQQQKLANRIKNRKLKSESSINGDDIHTIKQHNFKKQIQAENIEEYVPTKQAKKRSIGKESKRKLQHLFASFTTQIKN